MYNIDDKLKNFSSFKAVNVGKILRETILVQIIWRILWGYLTNLKAH